ncbi:MAG: enoyl-CoA hydratase/isomerase family protein [Rhodospirillales bacterium]
MNTGAGEDALIRTQGAAGRITLNRPHALNALTHAMTLSIEAALRAWAEDDAVRLVIIDGAGDKAFSAGGDVAALHRTGAAGEYTPGRLFWRDEYRLNALIAGYAKPYIAVMDGVVMGGGAGVSIHGSHRIVTERTVAAMPECAIGVIPDIGAAHILANTAPGETGLYLALTGARMNAADAMAAGFADVFAPAARIPDLIEALCAQGAPGVIEDFTAASPQPGPIAALEADIAEVFAAAGGAGSSGVVEIQEKLRASGAPWAAEALSRMAAASPLSLLAAAENHRRARIEPGVKSALTRDYRFVSRCMEHGDFLEGVRALIIDKDRAPVWRYPDVKSVPAAAAAMMTAEAEGGDLAL